MRPLLVVIPPPVFKHHSPFSQRIDQLSVQASPPESPVETLRIPVLPRTSRLDINRLDAIGSEPPLNRLRDELRPVVAPDVFRCPVLPDSFRQHFQHIIRLDRPIRMDAVAFPRVFINQIEHSQFSAPFRVIAHKVPGPHVVPMACLLRQTRGHSSPALPWLRWRHL